MTRAVLYWMRLRALGKYLAMGGVLITGPAAAVTCADVSHKNTSFTICTVDVTHDRLRLFLNDADGAYYGGFSAVDAALGAQQQRLSFAMNAGMYHQDRAPVGHYVENGVEAMRIIPNAGPGNFGMLPNGILCLASGRADVIETLAFITNPPACRDATQSGPMLVIEGALHPRFLPDSRSRYIRNGVGTTADGKTAIFAISNVPVTFHDFGTLFRDVLHMPNALYFDGNVSRLHAPALDRSDRGRAMGPIVGVTVPVSP